MQSGPNNALKSADTIPPTSEYPTTHQHGLSSQTSSGRGGADSESPSNIDTGNLDSNDVQSEPTDAPSATSQETRMSRTPSPPADRVSAYESALTPLRTDRKENLFQVIDREFPGDGKNHIQRLPNEILTHALAELSSNDLFAISLVSRHFHKLVTAPYAWRAAFARYFRGSESLNDDTQEQEQEVNDAISSGKRVFARLSALASWRSEYILRTRLLHSLARGRPVQIATTTAVFPRGKRQPQPSVDYESWLYSLVNHIHVVFGSGELNNGVPRVIHGTDEDGISTFSEPTNLKIDARSRGDPTHFFQFADANPGDSQWGLGSGQVVGCPNVMDVSQPYGMLYGQGHSGCEVYYRAGDEQRGRFLAPPGNGVDPNDMNPQAHLGIPSANYILSSVTSVWIAKSSSILSLSDGLVGILCGLSCGVISSYSLGSDGNRGPRFARGEVTARWVLSPGVPIISIAVDNDYSLKRLAQNRIWAVALNALGEIFYLTKFPHVQAKGNRTQSELDSWKHGRTTHWNLVEASRRIARFDPHRPESANGSYSPRSSWDSLCLSPEQINAETYEIEEHMRKKPLDFRRECLGWDMRRRMEVDFAGNDEENVGESVIVFECGLDEETVSRIQRYTRCKFDERLPMTDLQSLASCERLSRTSSIFGGPPTPDSDGGPQRFRRASVLSNNSSPERGSYIEEWRLSHLSFGDLRPVAVTATTIDCSTFSTLTSSEDPALGFATSSNASSPFASPMSAEGQPTNSADVPGQRARFVAAGTRSGIVLLWDIRAPVAKSPEFPNTIDPVRIIYTASPEISSLALTALYVVHGGNDGLVQAWDPLASTIQPIRTLHSRFSSVARRRLIQAQASALGVGINMFAAGAICLDPDPTVLRGIVSIGNKLRYWSFSSSVTEQKGNKRRLRRPGRSAIGAGAHVNNVRMNEYIDFERNEMEYDERNRISEQKRLAQRFGIDLINNEDDAVAYATLLSQETLEDDRKRKGNEGFASGGEMEHANMAKESSSASHVQVEEDIDPDIAEAMRLSLLEQSSEETVTDTFDIPIRYAKSRKSTSRTKKSPSPKSPSQVAGGSRRSELDDLEFAMQLSLAEEQSRRELESGDEGIHVSSALPSSKGKGRAR